MKTKEYSCAQCTKLFEKSPYLVRNPSCVFCSKDCRNKYLSIHLKGDKNPNYRGGINIICECGRKKDYRAEKCAICSNCGFPIDEEKVTEEEFRKAVAVGKNKKQIAEDLGINRKTVNKRITDLGLNIDHFSAGRHRPIPTEKLLSIGEKPRNNTVKTRVISEGLKENACEICKQPPIWQGKTLVMELHHINGNCYDNRIENLQILCPNCHTQTPNNKGKKSSVKLRKKNKTYRTKEE